MVVTLLYVPADRADRVRKAIDSDADVVIVDLEDAVAPSAKTSARENLPGLLEAAGSRAIHVRINGLESPWGDDDAQVVSLLHPDVEVRVPKVDSPDHVQEAVSRLGPRRRLHCLLESAVAVEHAFDIARAGPQVASIGLGEADLGSDLGARDEQAMAWSRGRIVIAARAAGLPPPAQSVYPAVRDLPGLEESTRAGRAQGFVGRCAIHPVQLPVIRAAHRPDEQEVSWARQILQSLDAAHAADRGTLVLPSGDFADVAMVAGARRVLALEHGTRPMPRNP